MWCNGAEGRKDSAPRNTLRAPSDMAGQAIMALHWRGGLRSFAASLIGLVLVSPALGGPAYTPVKLAPASTVTPPAELVSTATDFLKAVRTDNGDAIGATIAERLTVIDGALDLALPRHRKSVGPFNTTEDKLVALSNYIGGDVEPLPDGSPSQPNQLKAARQYIVDALTDGQSWGSDPMLKGAICSYAYRSYDPKAVKKLADQLGEPSSALFYVDAPTPVLKSAGAKAEVAATLMPDLLYVVDYQTDAPIYWHAIHLPDGGTGFIAHEKVELRKPYAGGICFGRNKSGAWQMIAQVSTSL